MQLFTEHLVLLLLFSASTMCISMSLNVCESNGKIKTSQLVLFFCFFPMKKCAEWGRKQEKCTTNPVTESTLHKIISEEIWYLFITTSVADFLPPLVLTDWPFAALASSHRWHLHLSWPECWGGERPKHPNNNTSQTAAKWIIGALFAASCILW